MGEANPPFIRVWTREQVSKSEQGSVGTQEATARTSGGFSSPSNLNPSVKVARERNWGQAGETAARGAGHSVRMLICRQMGKQGHGGAERRVRGDMPETNLQRYLRDMSGNNKHTSTFEIKFSARSLGSYIAVRGSLSLILLFFLLSWFVCTLHVLFILCARGRAIKGFEMPCVSS